MRRTEAGKRLYQLWLTGSDYDTLDPKIVDAIDAIEAEAREQGVKEWIGHGVELERERIREAVEGLDAREGMEYADEYQVGWGDLRAAVLAIIDGKERSATPAAEGQSTTPGVAGE